MARTSLQQKLGKKIKTLRNDAGLSQEKLGELTGLDRTYISDIERGIRNPSLKSLQKLANALKISISDLTKFS
jgi:transcriptional regulator with XRE-family HTH domain